MIPILFDKNTSPKDILANSKLGLGMLNDCISATVTEELNGSYELEIKYPINGAHFDEIDYCSWIKAKPFVDGDIQLFRVYKISKPLDGVCTINAEHVSYLLDYAIVDTAPNFSHVESLDLWQAMQTINSRIMESVYASGGNLHFDLAYEGDRTAQQFFMDKVRSVRDYLLGKERSLLTLYGGEFEFNNFSVCLYQSEPPGSRGSDRGVTIQYGKNLCSLRQEVSDEGIVTRYYPYIVVDIPPTTEADYGEFLKRDITWYAEVSKFIDVHPIELDNYPYPRTIALNLKDFEKWKNVEPTEQFALPITSQDFYDCVFQYVLANMDTVFDLHYSLDVSFISVGDSEEYKNIKSLEKVNMADYVTVEYPKFNISKKLKVTKTEFNVLEERYNKVTLGSPRKTLV